MSKAVFKPLALTGALSLTALFSLSSNATIVEFQTSHGNFTVNLHDETTPETVANFLNYVNDDDYDNTIFHRLISNFIIQGGGYAFEGDFPLRSIEVDGTILNEPVYSNVKYTIAMAKVSNNVNSASSQWFINTEDNSANLDLQNGGFTVFGEVVEGMDNIDTMASVSTCDDIPMPGYTDEQCADASFVPGVENFVTIYDVVITDPTVVTDANLASVENTLLNQDTPPEETPPSDDDSSGGGGGGSLSFLTLCALSLLGFRRKNKAS